MYIKDKSLKKNPKSNLKKTKKNPHEISQKLFVPVSPPYSPLSPVKKKKKAWTACTKTQIHWQDSFYWIQASNESSSKK